MEKSKRRRTFRVAVLFEITCPSPPQISLFPTHLVDVQSQSLVSLVQKGSLVPIVKEFFFLMVLPQESLIYFRVPPVLLFREMLGRIVFCRASGGR